MPSHPVAELRRLAACALLVAAVSCARKKADPSCRVVIEAPTRELGFGADVELRAREECDGKATGAPIRWSTGATGNVVHLRTPSAEERLLVTPRAGVLPVSADQADWRVSASAGAVSSEV